MKKVSFHSTISGQKISNIMDIAVKRLDFLVDQKDEEALRKFWSTINNIRGNLKSIHNNNDKNSWTIKTNKTQLNENLYKLYLAISKSDTWFEDCKFLIKKHYDWSDVARQIERLCEKLSDNEQQIITSYLNQCMKLWDFCEYTDEELIILVSNHPYISKLYNGDNETIKNLGVILL